MKNLQMKMVLAITVIFISQFMVNAQVSANNSKQMVRDNDPFHLRTVSNKTQSSFNHIPKREIREIRTDWKTIIDSTWGVGLSTSDKLAIFDTFWNVIDEDYAGFPNSTVDWDVLYSYRDTVALGVSRGRFYGIMCHLRAELGEVHTRAIDLGVEADLLEPGVPLFIASGWLDVSHFGAGLTALPDSSLLVYTAVEDHPMDLEPGDVVLGYDGMLWKDIYPELLEAQLPWGQTSTSGSSPASAKHTFLTAAGMNWHLFDTLDVHKYGTTDTLHLPTSMLVGHEMEIWATEQLPVPGVPMPDYMNGNYVSWGVVEGTDIGYIYVWTWWDGAAFLEAVTSLMYEHETNGLIIDFRTQAGGSSAAAFPGFRELFNVDQDAVSYVQRDDPDDRYSFVEITTSAFEANSNLYDKPIAVMVGPFCRSAGDNNLARIRQHPMVRTFGKPSSTAFTSGGIEVYVHNGWSAKYSGGNMVMRSDPTRYLAHLGFDVDEEIWFDRNDVALGYDTVVGRAIEWIQNVAYAHHIEVDKSYARPGIDSVWINAKVENPLGHELQVSSHIFSMDSSLHDSMILFDDGTHEDGLANDGLWGVGWPTVASESNYTIDFATMDVTDGTSRILPKGTWFTTVGPLVQVGYQIVNDEYPNPGDYYRFHLDILNQSDSITVPNVSVQLRTIDSLVVAIDTRKVVGNLAPGQVDDARYLAVDIAEFEPMDTLDLPVGVDIYSNNTLYWVDTLWLTIRPVGLGEGSNLWPSEYALIQNFPNPFNPTTTIQYSLPEAGSVNLTVFDIRGQEVTTLLNTDKPPGNYEVQWNGMDRSGNPVSTGVYFCRLEAGSYSQTIKMVYLR